MIGIIISALLFIFIAYMLYYGLIIPAESKQLKKPIKNQQAAALYPVFLLLAAAFMARVISSVFYLGYRPDISCFSSWADMVYEHGFSAFYTLDAFTDYPPGYMYILYVIGFIKSIFHMDSLGTATVLLLKMPAILCDLAAGYLIYVLARKHTGTMVCMIITGLYLFNPAIFTDSALWGQVDSVLTLCLLAIVLCIYYKKLIPAYFLFALAILIKPQALIMTPVLIYAVIEQVFLHNFSWKNFGLNLGLGLCAIGTLAVLMCPFGMQNVIMQYTETLGSYPYASVNAFNLWGAFNLNWEPLQPWMSYIGTACIVLIVAASAVIFFCSKKDSKYFFTAAFLFFATFVLSTKMHERYAFPCMIMLVCAYVLERNIHIFSLYTLCSATQFLNMGYVLFLYANDTGKYYRTPTFILFSIITVAVFVYMLYISYATYIRQKNPISQKNVRS